MSDSKNRGLGSPWVRLDNTDSTLSILSVSMPHITKYNAKWDSRMNPLQIELECIKWGGKWNDGKCGEGMLFHLMEARKLLWPQRYRHEWTDLMYENFITNDITILMGCASSQKTSHASEYVIIKYLCSPHNTLIILSTIDTDKLDTGVWAEVKMLWESARNIWPDIAGNIIEYRRCIATDSIEEGDVRDLRKGILSRPCYVGSQWVGLGKLAGTKQTNVIFLADELQHMAETFIASWANLFANDNAGGRVQVIGSGNPDGDPDSQLGLAAEPKEGWASIGEPSSTAVWDTKYMGGKCVNLVGTDSPNFRNQAKGVQIRYPGLIGPRYLDRLIADYGKDSIQYYKNGVGIMKTGMVNDRVITRSICKEHRAHDIAVWKDDSRVKIHGMDPSYGGSDACISVVGEFGKDINGKVVFNIIHVRQHRFALKEDASIEDQIAEQTAGILKDYGIPVTNSFYDPYGKGTIGFAYSRKFGSNCPIPVDSGARATERPVRQDLFIYDKAMGQKRLKKCSEHYQKFVTEAWFSVRYTIESGQMRNFPEDIMKDMCARKYKCVAGDKISVEPKDELKERTGKSPNYGDAMAICLEGARQRGFQIAKLGNSEETVDSGFTWMKDRATKHTKLMQSKQLAYG